MSLESVFKLSLVMNMLDNLSGPMAGISLSVGSSVTKMEGLSKSFAGAAVAGTAMAGVGTQITDAVLAPVKATFETSRAIGELSSLGVKDLQAVEDAAKGFSDQWAGTTKSDFITAAYDIKSGIASLSDEGVAQMTSLAALTGKATKSTAAEMTSLFATGYGIYKDYYSDLTDIQFGEMFSAGIAKSVQQFKTTGSGMAQSIQSLGGSATTANVPLEEQLSILGMLQATMGGAEAGTKYKAFLRSAAKGGEELGLKFTDANNQLLSMPEILDKLRGKFGETMDAAEKMELQKAMGDTESVALIDLMYSKVGDLQGNIVGMYDALGSGVGIAQQMATAINSNEPSRYEVLQQRIQNLKETIGTTLLPTINEYLKKGEQVVGKLSAWAEKNPELVKAIMLVLLTLGSFLIISGSVIGVTSAIGLVFVKLSKFVGGFVSILNKVPGAIDTVRIVGMYGFDLIKKVAGFMPKLISSVWSFSAALLANPITWIVLGIIALIVVIILLWRNWDKVSAWISGVWNKVCGGLKSGLASVKGFFQGIIDWVKGKFEWFRDAGKRLITTFVGGVKSVAMAPINAVKNIFGKIKNLFPHSDAKEGPLSTLTLSGQRTMTTFAQGVALAESAPAEAVEASLAKTSGALRREPPKKVKLRSLLEADEADVKERSADTADGVYIAQLLLNVDFATIKELPALLKLLRELRDKVNADGGDVDDAPPAPAYT